MPIYLNLLIMASYGILAAAVAVAVTSSEVPIPYLLAGLVLALGGLLHTMLVRVLRWRDAAAEIDRMRGMVQSLKVDVEALRHGVMRIHHSVQTAEEQRGASEGHNVKEIVAEVRVLQSLIEGLQSRSGQGVVRMEPAIAVGGGRPPRRPLPTIATGLNESQILDFVQEGLKADRVDLYLQPVVSLPQRKRRFYECYSRIRAEDGSIITPEQYLELAVREGLIGAIDNMLLFRCVQLVRKVRLRHREVGFFCNISPNNLSDQTFFTEFVEFMTQNAELAPHLFFEFSQADAGRFDAATLRQLGHLANYGFRFSLDRVSDLRLDLRALRERGFAYVKLDVRLVLESIRGDKPILDLRALKGALDRAGLDLIIEKLENEQDLLELLDYQIDYAQGFLFGEPRPSREV